MARLPMRKIREALRLRASGLTTREVGTSTVVPLASLHQTRDAALQLESEGSIDINHSTFRVIRHDQHPMGRWCDPVAPNAVRTRTGQITIPGPMPKYGQHTSAILARLGYDNGQIDEMIADGVVAEAWSEKCLPE